jgi:hypothetical protein
VLTLLTGALPFGQAGRSWPEPTLEIRWCERYVKRPNSPQNGAKWRLPMGSTSTAATSFLVGRSHVALHRAAAPASPTGNQDTPARRDAASLGCCCSARRQQQPLPDRRLWRQPGATSPPAAREGPQMRRPTSTVWPAYPDARDACLGGLAIASLGNKRGAGVDWGGRVRIAQRRAAYGASPVDVR